MPGNLQRQLWHQQHLPPHVPSKGQRQAVTLIPAPKQEQKPEVATQVEMADFSGLYLQRLGYYVGGRPTEEHLFGSAQ